MTTSVRSTVERAAVALAVCVAFVLATFVVRPHGAEDRRAASFVAARAIAHLSAELRSAKSTEAPSLSHAIERTAERINPTHAFGSALPASWFEHVVAPALLDALLERDAAAAGSRQRTPNKQHRSRAPPRLV